MPTHRAAACLWVAGALAGLASSPAAAQDARRGAALYMRLPGGGAASVVWLIGLSWAVLGLRRHRPH